MPAPTLSPIALALGRIPTGLYIVSTAHDGQRLGFVGSFLMQVGFQPPVVCVAIAKDRTHLATVREAGFFAISVLDTASEKLMSRFFKKYEPGAGPFDGLKTSNTPAGAPVLDDALAWFECRVTGEHAAGDHVVVFGAVTQGLLARDGDPSIHLRKNGFGY